ncbi:MBL fold metallo-hydrolase [candidate division KSB1 bacterium]|nr:MBL fold metallo-hydrolase [candidate division KSB1 bacterium]NIR69651.1 MBL fold metallo-hydrolase [candidate division KSB1 bacterium]NIS22880.1 MBL fold metallo-hydrolase [candidate division KSB1 bacterium]NIT69718.1 MBL fold metallo-hydrolase [candidate division KSB1 bacterium]NIU23386.1 MBL fold metallo-hydrolase [candidate division KSB1 bacterium]
MAKRNAVSLLLTRDANSTEVYLVERNPKLRFFGGYFAFPGGTLDGEEEAVDIKNASRVPKENLEYLVTAAREIFEETGVLLTANNSPIPKERADDYRKKLLAGEINFSEILKREGRDIDAADFHPICDIITPEFSPVRYNTQFYWVQIPEGQSPEIWPGELVSGEFFEAEEALNLWEKGDMLIVPPMIMMLKELIGRSVKTFIKPVRELANSYVRGTIHQVYFTPGVQMITLKTRTLPPATHTNCYLVGESELYIVDPAPSLLREQERLWQYLDNQLAEGRSFKGILLTHHHSDHIGALRECQYRYDLPIWVHEKTAEKLPNFEFEGHLQHGDELDLGQSPDGQPGWKLKVYHTPGHAEGHLAFQENRYGAVIAGDMISTVSTIVISPPGGHMATYLRSLELLESVTSGTLYPSHGPALREGKEVVRYYIKHRQEREQKLLNALSEQPQTTSALVKKVYDDVDKRIWPLAKHSLRAGLIKLIEEDKCQQEGDKYKLA